LVELKVNVGWQYPSKQGSQLVQLQLSLATAQVKRSAQVPLKKHGSGTGKFSSQDKSSIHTVVVGGGVVVDGGHNCSSNKK
jgi:hypothetical protein